MAKKAESSDWTPIADMMSGLMVIFLLLAISFISEAQEEFKRYSSLKEELYKDLTLQFRDDLDKWNAELDEETLTLRFNEPDILFENGSSKLNPKFVSIINDFFPRYTNILMSEKYQEKVAEVRIEGHTSSRGVVGSLDEDANYYFNLSLSQERARNVLVASIESLSKQSAWRERSWLREKLTANGLSSSRLITKALDSSRSIEDEGRSRRVEFRVELTKDSLLDSMRFSGARNEN